MEPESALIWADCAVELHPEAAVYIYLASIIRPGDTELYNSFRLNHSFKQSHLLIFGMLIYHDLEGFKNLLDGLDEFRLMRVARLDFVEHFLHIRIHWGDLRVKVIILFQFPVLSRKRGTLPLRLSYARAYTLSIQCE